MSREQPSGLRTGIGKKEFDCEGRVIRGDFDNLIPQFPKFSVVSLYLPSGSASETRQSAKFRFLDAFEKILNNWMKEHSTLGREFILCGDWNIAHKEIDLKNWKGNKKNSGFLPEEREWLDDLFDNDKYIDGFRLLNKKKDEYTWWSNRGNARENNVGWRIDYQIISGNLKNKIQKEKIYREKFFSDHAPLIFTYKI
jgi:exodeoxyribonuclease-3